MGQKRVLVVDDSPENLSSLCGLLEVWAYDVDTADDGPLALLALARRHPHVVVMDLGLRDGFALDVIRGIKAKDDHVAVIAFSGWHQLEAAARAAGADAFGLEHLLASAAPAREPEGAKKTG